VPLVPFASLDRSTLRWIRTAETPAEYTLLAGDAPVAVLTWARHGGSRAAARTSEGEWTLKRNGYLVSHLTVRRAGEDAPIARLSLRFGHHEIEVGGGGVYWLRRASLLVPAWKLTGAGDREYAHIEPVPEGRHLGGGAVLTSGSAPARELLLLLVLSWYLIVLAWFEDETVETLAPFEGPDAPMRSGG